MGTYCTTTALQTLMPNTQFNTATSSIAALAIQQAESEINKYLSKRYDLSSDTFQTATSVPPMVRTFCEWLATGYTFESMSRGGKEQFTRSDRFINRAINNLKMIADYNLDLLHTSGSVVADKGKTALRVLSNTSDYSSTFNEDDPLNWAVDPDKLDDIADERDA